MGTFSIWHWLIVLMVVLLLFGRGKISDLMGDVAKGIKSFKKGIAEDDEEEETAEPVKSIEHDETEPVKTRKSADKAKAS